MGLYKLGERAPQLAADTWVADNATLVGSVRLESGASVWYGVVIRADNDLITIGEHSNVQDNAVLHTDAGFQLSLGREVTIGHQAMLHGCSVGDGSLIGIGAIVLNGACIGSGSIVAAGAFVPEGRSYPDRSLILGSPAKVVRELSESEVAGLRTSAQGYWARWQIYRSELVRLQP